MFKVIVKQCTLLNLFDWMWVSIFCPANRPTTEWLRSDLKSEQARAYSDSGLLYWQYNDAPLASSSTSAMPEHNSYRRLYGCVRECTTGVVSNVECKNPELCSQNFRKWLSTDCISVFYVGTISRYIYAPILAPNTLKTSYALAYAAIETSIIQCFELRRWCPFAQWKIANEWMRFDVQSDLARAQCLRLTVLAVC